MKTYVPCPDCFSLEKRPITFYPAELRDSGVAYVSCPNGHSAAVVYERQRHEILLRSAVAALLVGYAQEATSVAFTALERAYEFAIRVLCRHRGADAQVLDDTWKAVANRSERQYGAFCFLYAAEFNEAWHNTESLAHFRNKVIHRGYLASEKEAWKHCEQVHDLISRIDTQLETHAQHAVEEELESESDRQAASIPAGMNWIKLKAQVAIIEEGSQARLSKSFSEFRESVRYEMSQPPSGNRGSSDSTGRQSPT